jgi:hypothetical protein
LLLATLGMISMGILLVIRQDEVPEHTAPTE